MKASFLTILAFILTACGPAKRPQQTSPEKYPAKTVALLLHRIEAALPKGWRISYEKGSSLLTIDRDEAVVASHESINAPIGGWEKPGLMKLHFSLRVIPFVSPDEYRRLSAENNEIQAELSVLYEQLVSRGLPHKFDGFLGRTDEEKAAVARYNALKISQHSLPDYYFEDISFVIWDWLDDESRGAWIYIEDKAILEECERVQKKVLELLTQYKGAAPR